MTARRRKIDRIFVPNDVICVWRQSPAVAATNRRAICIFVRDEVWIFQEDLCSIRHFRRDLGANPRAFSNLKIANQEYPICSAPILKCPAYICFMKSEMQNPSRIRLASCCLKPFQFRRNILHAPELWICAGLATSQSTRVLLPMFIVYITLWWLYLRGLSCCKHTIHMDLWWRVNWTAKFVHYHGFRLSCMKYTNELWYKNVL